MINTPVPQAPNSPWSGPPQKSSPSVATAASQMCGHLVCWCGKSSAKAKSHMKTEATRRWWKTLLLDFVYTSHGWPPHISTRSWIIAGKRNQKTGHLSPDFWINWLKLQNQDFSGDSVPGLRLQSLNGERKSSLYRALKAAISPGLPKGNGLWH